MEETDQWDSLLASGPGGQSRLLTGRDPVLGGMQELCGVAGKINTVYTSKTTLRHYTKTILL